MSYFSRIGPISLWKNILLKNHFKLTYFHELFKDFCFPINETPFSSKYILGSHSNSSSSSVLNEDDSSSTETELRNLLKLQNRLLLQILYGDGAEETIPYSEFWNSLVPRMLFSKPERPKLPCTESLNVINLLKTCNKIIVLTGAGVSVSCGIPDFRSPHGIYAKLAVDFPDLPSPQSMFDIQYFRRNPKPFFAFAKEIYPGHIKPSPCHRFIRELEKKKKLLRNYSQNIDTLEKVAGIENVVECHGSLETATCIKCNHRVKAEEIKEDIFKQQIPYCPVCDSDTLPESERGIMKPDIVFFGEEMPKKFYDSMDNDVEKCDLLIVIGSSLKVQPVSIIPDSLPRKVPQILINRERLPRMNFDIELLGDCDIIIDHICRLLGEEWKDICCREAPLTDATNLLMSEQSLNDTNVASKENEAISTTEEEVKCQKIGSRQQGGSGDDFTRHTSMDSSRDSGIGETSNSASGCQPSTSLGLLDEVPKDAFFKINKRCFVFPGADVDLKSIKLLDRVTSGEQVVNNEK